MKGAETEEKIVDLSDIGGFERLYVSLAQREDGTNRNLSELLYDWYRANLVAQEKNNGREMKPIRKEIFMERMAHSEAKAYRTEVQLIRAAVAVGLEYIGGRIFPRFEPKTTRRFANLSGKFSSRKWLFGTKRTEYLEYL